MSNGIMERNLPVAESLGSGDKVRIVTAAGNSKQIDASQVGGGSVFLIVGEESGDDIVLNKTWQEIHDAFVAHIPCYISYTFSKTDSEITETQICNDLVTSVNSDHYSPDDTTSYYVQGGDFFVVENNPNGYPILSK